MLPDVFSNSSMTSEAIFAGRHCFLTEIFLLLFKFKLTRTPTIFGDYGILAHTYTITAKPIKSLELHYPMIQLFFFFIND